MELTKADRADYMPPIEPWAAPFWDALTNGRLLLGWCARCETPSYPPVDENCGVCGAARSWREASGVGQLWSWTTTHREYVAGYPLAPPYTVLMIDLPEGLQMLAALSIESDPADLLADAAMVFEPRELAPGTFVPAFRPAS